MTSIDMQSLCSECGHHIVLGRFRITTCHGNRCPTGSKYQCQVGGLGFQMNTNRHPLARERTFLSKLILQLIQDRHVASYPLNLLMTLTGQFWRRDDVGLHNDF